MKKYENHLFLVLLLALLSSVPPLATDTYIPSIPDIANAFNVTFEKIELTIPIFLLGFSLGQLCGGLFSDKVGRRKSSLVGLLGFSLFSFAIIFSHSVYELWIYRFSQALFGGMAFINAFAVVRDKFHAKEAAKVLSLLGSIGGIAPLIAPVIGASFIHFFHWNSIFAFLGIYSFVAFVLIYFYLEETHQKTSMSMFASFKDVITKKEALKYMILLGVSFSGFFVFISKASFIYIEYFHISQDYFPLFFGINFIFMILMVKVNMLLLKQHEILFLIKMAFFVQIIDGIIFISLCENISLWMAMIVIGVYMASMSFVFGNIMALALEFFPNNAGIATSVLGVIQFGLASFLSSFVLLFHATNLFPIAISVTIISLFVFLFVIFGFSNKKKISE
jgi:MFS transporter, DHA1 family, multidrug resistance protein